MARKWCMAQALPWLAEWVTDGATSLGALAQGCCHLLWHFQNCSGLRTFIDGRKYSCMHTCSQASINLLLKEEEKVWEWLECVLSGWQGIPGLEQHGLCEEQRRELFLELNSVSQFSALLTNCFSWCAWEQQPAGWELLTYSDLLHNVSHGF